MKLFKNSFPFGILLGLVFSTILLVILDAVVYFIYHYNGKKVLDVDVTFALCILVNFLLARKFFRTKEKQELGKGFLFASFLWGAAYVYLFFISPIRALFFPI